MIATDSSVRTTRVLDVLEVPTSSWYRQPTPAGQRKRPGPAPRPLPASVVRAVVSAAGRYPWYGYKKIAVICRRAGEKVKNRHAYRIMKEHGLLQRRRCPAAEIHQASKLYELLPQGPNELWQMDITYIHIPGSGWWYAITVIDYFSRYLLACRLANSYCAFEVTAALDRAREEAERLCGPLPKRPVLVTDNGPSFLAKRFQRHTRDLYQHVRIRYRTPTQLGLLERFHRTLKTEEVYWRLYDSPAHARQCLEEFRQRYNTIRPHWALIPPEGGDPLTPHDVYVGGRAIGIPRWQTWAKAARGKLEQWMTEEAA
jgi:transposase InsO family protein